MKWLKIQQWFVKSDGEVPYRLEVSQVVNVIERFYKH